MLTPSGYSNQLTSEVDSTFGRGIGAIRLPALDAYSKDRPPIAIMSLGEMGMGIASLLRKYSYPVVTNVERRSARTKARAEAAGVKILIMEDILSTASVFLSIVPPAEALPLAQLVVSAAQTSSSSVRKLVYIDLNAISPTLSLQISSVVVEGGMKFIDGAIIGFPPKELDDETWFQPAITLSGPKLADEPWSEMLATLLNVRHVGDDVGAASGLKMCFGALYKGQSAIAIQAYTTAERLGVLGALRQHLAEYFPHTTPIVESSVVGSQRKAYRWIKEMEEIEDTFNFQGGWSRDLFRGVADVFRAVAYETNLEKESKTNVDDVTTQISQRARRKSC